MINFLFISIIIDMTILITLKFLRIIIIIISDLDYNN
jgi:hypothetical protein